MSTKAPSAPGPAAAFGPGDRVKITGTRNPWRGNTGTVTGRYRSPMPDVARWWAVDLDNGASTIGPEYEMEASTVPAPPRMAGCCQGSGEACACGDGSAIPAGVALRVSAREYLGSVAYQAWSARAEPGREPGWGELAQDQRETWMQAGERVAMEAFRLAAQSSAQDQRTHQGENRA